MKNKGYIVDLPVKADDKKLKNVSSEFLKDIEKNFTIYKKDYSENSKALAIYSGNKNFFFEPEVLGKKSPLTIINAPWGTGKTFFIENFIKLFIDNELNSKVFEKIMIIEAWKFSNSKDVFFDFAEDLATKLIAASGVKSTDKEKTVQKVILKKILRALKPSSVSLQIAMGPVTVGPTWDFNNKDEQIKAADKKAIEEIWKKISMNSSPTLIFVDNLERLGSGSWDLLKTILKFQEFPNFLIILAMDMEKLKKVDNSEKGEFPIEKYIDFNSYNFRQDYSNFFEKYYSDQKFINSLNAIFNFEINGSRLSIREVEASFKSNGLNRINENEKRYKILRKVTFNIWDSKEVVFNTIKDDVHGLLQEEKIRYGSHMALVTELFKKSNRNEFVNLSQSELQDEKDILITNDGALRPYIPFGNYSEAYEKWKKVPQKRDKEWLEKIDDTRKNIEGLEEKNNGFLKKISELEEKEKELNLEIEKANVKKTTYDSTEHTSLEMQRNNGRDKIFELRTDVNNGIKKIDQFTIDMKYFKSLHESVFTKIEEKIKEIETISAMSNFSKATKGEIIRSIKLDSNFAINYLQSNYSPEQVVYDAALKILNDKDE